MIDNDNNLKNSIKDWWSQFPMTYGTKHGKTQFIDENGIVNPEFSSRTFFENSDRTFYSWNEPLHGPDGKFSRLFDYRKYENKNVLEVGCGLGCMAMNWAIQGGKITAVDLNPVAVAQTRSRFQHLELEGDIRESDAESLPFEDNLFDFVYSWGVLHHTPGTRKAIEEITRVLKPGGEAGVMLYNRRSLLYRFIVDWQEGFVNMEKRWLSDLELASRYGDGDRDEGNPHTWPVTQKEIRQNLFSGLKNVNTRVLGTDIRNILNIWAPNLGQKLEGTRRIDALARRWGWSLWTTAIKEIS